MGKFKNSTAIKAGIIACAAASSALAQDQGGLAVSLDLSQKLQYSDNVDLTVIPDAGFQAVTDILLSGSSQTRSEKLSFSLGTTGSFDDGDSASNGFTDPTLKFSYRRDAKSASVSAYASFLRTEISSIVGDDDPNLSFVVLSTGDREDLRYGADLEVGRDAPLSAKFKFSVSDRDYIDTTDPSLVDSRTTVIGADVSLRFDRRITGRVNTSLSRLKEASRTRETFRFGVGADLDVSRTLRVGLSADYYEVETDSGGTTATTDGVGFTLTAAQQLKNGSMTGSLSSDIDEGGRRTTMRFARSMELRSGGSFDASVGLTSQDGDIDPLYSLSYGQELPRGAMVNASITQSIQTDVDGNDSLNSSLSASYARALTDVSSFIAGVQYKVTDGLDVAGEDASLVDLDLMYRHELVRDWDITAGYKYSLATADLEQDRSSNTVYVGIEKSFDWK